MQFFYTVSVYKDNIFIGPISVSSGLLFCIFAKDALLIQRTMI